ncbi:Rossmann-like and DUF2520 domain-containing protein [Algibacter sp. PT7-4]|uniref:Rossmann-like and DUF2520 domain-containing protein n=1 Tax=Algibacter ulvanivorans TaxID=3400999 RepID=UPI003AADAA45
MISVVILGAGNVATHLFKGFENTNEVSVVQWYNRSISAIKPYSHLVNVTDNLNNLKEADIYIIAVSDDVISELSSKLPFKDRLVVHTSGSASVYDLDKKLKRGVLYPLQSFSKTANLNFANVPICIETIDKKSYPLLKKLAVSLGSPTKRINSEQRRVLHLAAVFVNNFTNQLYRIGHEITESEGAEFDLLKPLILETANKIQDISPFKAQTGPAKRNDKKTIKKHLKTLENEHHKAVYELLTDSIKRTHGRKKL